MIINTVEDLNKLPFPYKRTFIERDPKSIFKDIVKLNRTWNNDEYYSDDLKTMTPNVVSSGDYSIMFSLYEPMYFTFKCKPDDYKRYDIITDLFMEESRIKSYRPSISNVSPYTAWYSKTDKYGYKKDILKRMKSNNVTTEQLRELCYSSKIVSEVAHEKVIFLKSLFELINYNQKKLRIFDACAGWGDRLIASIAIDAELYIGVEPNDDSAPLFTNIINTLGDDRYKVLHDAMPNAEIGESNFDICFLSPPSFTSENYGTSEGQSVVTYPNRTDWTFGFLFPTIDKTWNLLAEGGILVVQSILISEINSYIDYKFPDAEYIGIVSVECGSGRKKCMWMWIKNSSFNKKLSIKRFNPIIRDILLGKKTYALLTSKKFKDYPNALVWNESGNDYSKYSKVLLYKCYDYFYNVDRFIQEIDSIGTKLINPLPLVRWNIRKTYLRDLANKGLDFIPYTVYSTDLTLKDVKNINTDKIIIKPVVGTSSHNVLKINRPRNLEDIDKIKQLMYKKLKYPYAKDEEFIVQPMYKSTHELSMVYFGDEYSHSIDGEPTKRHFSMCKELLKAIYDITSIMPRYSRIDFINDNTLLEVELIEPNMYLDNQLEVMLYKLKRS